MVITVFTTLPQARTCQCMVAFLGHVTVDSLVFEVSLDAQQHTIVVIFKTKPIFGPKSTAFVCLSSAQIIILM